eukprot:359683-Chlamydomonas_euryale.AAC.1
MRRGQADPVHGAPGGGRVGLWGRNDAGGCATGASAVGGGSGMDGHGDVRGMWGAPPGLGRGEEATPAALLSTDGHR